MKPLSKPSPLFDTIYGDLERWPSRDMDHSMHHKVDLRLSEDLWEVIYNLLDSVGQQVAETYP